MLNSFGFNPLGASPLGPHRSSLRLSIHFQGCAVPVETLLQCATCHSQFVRGSPLVPMQRTSMTGTTFSKFWYPRFRCGPNLVCDGERSLGEWGFLFERGSWVFIIGVVIAAGVVQCLAVVRRAVPVLLEFVFWPLLNHGNALIPPGIEGVAMVDGRRCAVCAFPALRQTLFGTCTDAVHGAPGHNRRGVAQTPLLVKS